MKRQQNRYLTNYSISKTLRENNKSNDYLELMLSNILLEDLIALKLEITSKTVGIPLYGFPIWKSLPYLVREAACKYAISITGTNFKAAKFLGISVKKLSRYLRKEEVQAFSIKK